MSGEKESVFVVEDQSLDVNETVKSGVLNIIETSDWFQKAIKKLEEEKLIWYFIGPLLQDKDIKEQINSRWKTDFQGFEQSINETHRKFEPFLPDQSFLAYSTKGNEFNIRFENEEKPIKISDILRASNKDEVYNISLGKDSQVTASRKNGNERHYDFAGSGSCEMTINWQANDSKGNSIDCSITVAVSSNGIERVVNEPKFGEITDPEEVLKLVKQNEEVFINGKTLYQAFTDMGKSVNDQQIPKKETFTQNPFASPRLLTPNSSGYSSPGKPSSRRSSFSSISELSGEDEMFEGGTSSDKEANEQEGEELENKIKELKKENAYLKKQNAELESRNKKIVEEGDMQISKLIEEKQILEEKVKEFEHELKKREKELAGKEQDIEQLKQQISALEQSQRDRNAKIVELNNQLKDIESKIQSTNRANEELQEKLDRSEAELSALKEENARLKNDVKKMLEGLKGDHEKQLVKLLSEKEKKLTDAISQLNEERLNNQELARELNQLRKKIETLELASQQSNIGETSLADGLSKGNTQEEIEKLQRQLRKKEEMLTHTQEELKSVKEALEQLQKILQQGEGERETAATSIQNIMDWPVPIPDDKPEEQKTPLEPTKINTKLSNPNSTSANNDPEKSRGKA
ncbi:hypothetical protein [Wolbachia endosymbiont of Cantharis cryptica]|uniref:hypothetical protein n=1 Tax=Wolbachia endosymbiont of Cantharis cryptica TaxID=3066132 RepID=UPI00376EE5B0